MQIAQIKEVTGLPEFNLSHQILFPFLVSVSPKVLTDRLPEEDVMKLGDFYPGARQRKTIFSNG